MAEQQFVSGVTLKHDSGATTGHPTVRLAASELAKYVSRCAEPGWREYAYTLDIGNVDGEGAGGFYWKIEPSDPGAQIRIVGYTAPDLLHGVYAFAQRYLGVRFSMSGDGFEAPVPVSASRTPSHYRESSSIALRGMLPWHNFLCGPTGWNELDYFRYVENMAKLRCNLLMFHVYTGGLERYWPYVEPFIRVSWMGVEPQAQFDTTDTARWGYVPRRPRDFTAETQAWFEDGDVFGSDLVAGVAERGSHYVRAASMLRRLIDYAHERGIRIALGFEPGIVPPEIHSVLPVQARLDNLVLDPCHPASREILHDTIAYIAEQYPQLDYVVLWQHEHAGLTHHIPRPNTPFAEFCRQHESGFAYLGDQARRMDGCWALATFGQAYSDVKRLLPQAKVVLAGWGGKEQFPLLLRGLHEHMPQDAIFTCLAPSLGTEDGPAELFELRDRDVWVIPWFEGDHQLWHPQPRLFTLERQIGQAERQGVSGVLAIHWRIRDIQDQFAYFGRRLWERSLTPETYYRDSWLKLHPDLPGEALDGLIAMDREAWFAGAASYEFYGFDAGWGELREEVRQALSRFMAVVEPVPSAAGSPLHQLKRMIEFSVRLDRCTRIFREAEQIKQKLVAERDHPGAKMWALDAMELLNAAEVPALLLAYAGKIDQADEGPAHRGELGVLSSMNQRILAYTDSMAAFFRRWSSI